MTGIYFICIQWEKEKFHLVTIHYLCFTTVIKLSNETYSSNLTNYLIHTTQAKFMYQYFKYSLKPCYSRM